MLLHFGPKPRFSRIVHTNKAIRRDPLTPPSLKFQQFSNRRPIHAAFREHPHFAMFVGCRVRNG